MKKVIFFLVSLSLLVSCGQPSVRNKGIKSEKISSYIAELKSEEYVKGEWTDVTLNEYDREGRKTRSLQHFPDSVDNNSSSYLYENGLLVKSEKYNMKNELIAYSTYTCDEKGKILSEQEYDVNGNLTCEKKNSYDRKQRLIAETRYAGQDSVVQHFSYGRQDFPQTDTIYRSGEPYIVLQYQNYQLDERGNLLTFSITETDVESGYTRHILMEREIVYY